MVHEPSGLSRRSVLLAVGGSLAASGVAGPASAGDDLVRANVGYSAESGRNAALAAADEVVHDFSFDALTLRVPADATAGLAARPDVRYVEADVPGRVFGQSTPWGVDRVDADRLHDNGESGAGAHVAVLDTGIVSDHPDLEANLGAGKAVVSCSGSNCAEPWDDDHPDSHGTHVAGIAGAVDDGEGVVGVGAGATLHAVKVCDDEGDCRPGDVASGLAWVTDRGYDVANVSLGFSHSDCVEDAVEAADAAGVLLVAATGKSGSDSVKHPAAEPEVIAVTATDRNDDVTDYSNTGPEVDLAAPGGAADDDPDTGIRSTVRGGYAKYFGTSVAAPHVSGAAALYVAAGVSKDETRDRLLSDAEDIGHPADEQGHGLLDAYRGFPYLSVVTDAAFPGTSTTTLRGDLADLAFTDSAECYFEYKRSVDSIYSESASVTRSTDGLYDVDVATTTDTAYDFRAVAEFSDGSVRRGDVLTFRTPEGDGGGTE